MVMQWYIEWLAQSRVPYLDHRALARLTSDRQPLLNGLDRYERGAAGTSFSAQDPQSVADAPTIAERIKASGVTGRTETERRAAYGAYLAMLGSSVAQLAAGVVHGYLNKRSLIVAAGQDGPRFRLQGDHTFLASAEGALQAALAAASSRTAIRELLEYGETGITVREISAGFPDHVEQDGALVSLRHWHETGLRDLCFDELFGCRRTRLTRAFLSAVSPRLGVPSADLAALRNDTLDY